MSEKTNNFIKNYIQGKEQNFMINKLNEKTAIMVSDFGQYIILGKVAEVSQEGGKTTYEITKEDFTCGIQEVDINLLFSQIVREEDGTVVLKDNANGDIFEVTSGEELRVFLTEEYIVELIKKTFMSGYDRASINNIVSDAIEKGIIKG